MEIMTKKTKAPKETIRVVIPYKGKKYDPDKYGDNRKCYLATELRSKGYKDVKVGGAGLVFIGDDMYLPSKEYSGALLELMFQQAEGLEVILVKQPKKHEI